MNNNPDSDKKTCANVIWDAQEQPMSAHFNDIYFSTQNGLDESRFVYLQGNRLAERWENLQQTHFCIAETGFGSGLNFLAAWQLWNQSNTGNSELCFISVEKYPLRLEHLSKALALWPELSKLAKLLIDNYPPQPWQGLQNIELISSEPSIKPIRLLLYFGDVIEAWQQLSIRIDASAELTQLNPSFGEKPPHVDAWFLDGFAPAKNPDMWSHDLFKAMAANSYKNTTAATFSCAAVVKNGLQQHGFSIQKPPGFGRKRAMLTAQFTGQALITTEPRDEQSQTAKPITYSRRRLGATPHPSWVLNQTPTTKQANKKIIIIGAGLSGAHIAYRLARQGFQIQVLERRSIASQASGNPAGAVFTHLGLGNDSLSEFNLSTQLIADQFYQQHGFYQRCGAATGLLHIDKDASSQQRFLRLVNAYSGTQYQYISAQQTQDYCGLALTHGGLWLPHSGWLNPAKLCAQLLQHNNIEIIENCAVDQLEYHQGQWHALTNTTTYQAELCIVCCAHEALHFEQLHDLPLKKIRGQVSFIRSDAQLEKLNAVVCGEGYVTPKQHDEHGAFHCAGATFSLNDNDHELREHDQQQNMNALARFIPDFNTRQCPLAGRVGFRTTSPDYLPFVGPVGDIKQSQIRFQPLRHKANADVQNCAAHYPGLYCALALGSRGLAYAPVAAQLISALINGTYLPVRRSIYGSLHPLRFAMRDLIKRKPSKI